MRFEILGPLRVMDEGRELNIGGPRQQAVLAALIAAFPECLSIDQIIDDVWGETPPSTAHHVSRTYLSNLRRTLGNRIVSDGRHYRLDISGDEIDSIQFARMLVEAIGTPDPAEKVRLLRIAESTWRGRPFGDPDGSLRVETMVAQLEEVRLRATELRLEAELDAGLVHEGVVELQGLVKQHPLRERIHQLLMLALYRSERQAEALMVCAGLRRRLAEELGVEPSEHTRELEYRILSQDPSLDVARIG